MNPYRHLTIIGLIALASIVFAGERLQSASYAVSYGTVPAAVITSVRGLFQGEWGAAYVFELTRLVTSLFLHGDTEHILFNMVFLWTFGLLVSETLGQLPALVIFLFCGVCGNILQVALNLESTIPIIGASGAICGLGGVYLGLAMRWDLPWPDVWPLAYPIPPLQLGAFSMLGFVADMYFLANHAQDVAYGAHVGGFVSGIATGTLITTVYPTVGRYQRSWGGA